MFQWSRKRFPVGNFVIYDYSIPYGLDRNYIGEEILLYVREDIPSQLIDNEMEPV